MAIAFCNALLRFAAEERIGKGVPPQPKMARDELVETQEGKIKKEIGAEANKKGDWETKISATLSRSLPSNFFSPRP
jgi:hypothetical protein